MRHPHENPHRSRVGSLGRVSEQGQVTVFEAVGGSEFFDELLRRFYGRVETDPVLRPLYPEDLTDSIRHTSLFLQQYWGGPGTYSELRGHPRLRARHLPFPIGERERDAWFGHMAAALDSLVTERGIAPEVEAQMLDYFFRAADFMINTR